MDCRKVQQKVIFTVTVGFLVMVTRSIIEKAQAYHMARLGFLCAYGGCPALTYIPEETVYDRFIQGCLPCGVPAVLSYILRYIRRHGGRYDTVLYGRLLYNQQKFL